MTAVLFIGLAVLAIWVVWSHVTWPRREEESRQRVDEIFRRLREERER